MRVKIVSIYNQKGGVGKTTTAINLAAGVGRIDKKVLLIDMDPQCNASSGLLETREGANMYDVLTGAATLRDAIRTTEEKNLDVAISSTDLAALDIEMATLKRRERRLEDALQAAKVEEDYDYIFIDCPPSLGLVPLNALVASNGVIIPIQCEYFALEGVGLMLKTLAGVQENLNPGLMIEGVVLTMYDGRNNLAVEVVEEVKRYFKDRVYKSVIPRNIRLAEAPGYAQSIFTYDLTSRGAEHYMKLAREFVARA